MTNLAARLCGEARAGQILVTRASRPRWRALAAVEAVGPLALKGFAPGGGRRRGRAGSDFL